MCCRNRYTKIRQWVDRDVLPRWEAGEKERNKNTRNSNSNNNDISTLAMHKLIGKMEVTQKRVT